MDIFDDGSAIDDSYDPIDLPQELADGASPLAYGRNNGPRSGHWTVNSTINGSAIDDDMPTIHGAPAVLHDGGSSRVKKIDGSVLRRLAIATDQQKKAEEEKKRAASIADESVKQDQVKEEKKQEKGFYVPRLEGEAQLLLILSE